MVVFFVYSNLSGYYTFLGYDFKANIQEEKTIFKMPKSKTRSNIRNGKKIERSKNRFRWYFGLFTETIFKV